MIVRERPNSLKLLIAWHGSVLPQILPQLLGVVTLSILLLLLHGTQNHPLPNVPIAAFSLIGLTLSIFLVFRNNACFDRWWEARKLWGSIIAQIRHLDRTSHLLTDDQRDQLMHYILVFGYSLHTRLRKVPLASSIQQWLSVDEYTQLHQHINPTHYALTLAHTVLIDALKAGNISDICYTQLNSHLTELGNAQAGCERILGTPLPFSYTLLLHRTAYLFCLLLPFGLTNSLNWFTPIVVALLAYTFFGLDALGNELEDPFGTENNDLPMDALLRVIEIDILTGLNAQTIPQPIKPINHVLS